MSQTLRIATFAALFAAAPLTASFAADRAPTAEENAEIGNVLFSEGFSSWGKIEFDDGQWEVDNAIDQDGNKRDVTLDQAFMIVNSDDDNED
jgi:hypothetical protein